MDRSYLVSYPPNLDSKEPTAVILAFHGGGGSPIAFRNVTSLDRVAAKRGFVTVFPEGYERSWNAGDRWGPAFEEKVDDVAYVEAILSDLSTSLVIDHTRVFAVGFSNGGSFAYRLGCDLSDKVAAIAVVAGSLNHREKSPSRPVPLLHIHGTQDAMSPFSGGAGSGYAKGTNHGGVSDTVASWLEFNKVSRIPTHIQAGARATMLAFQSRTVTGDVVLYIVADMGHQWPGGEEIQGLGHGADALSATRLIVDFFVTHPMAKEIVRLNTI